MSLPAGITRTRVARNHAFIAPDSHVPCPLAGWQSTSGIIHISPRMGAAFTMYSVHLATGSSSEGAAPGVQRCLYVETGALDVEVGGRRHRLGPGGFAYLPPDEPHRLTARRKGLAIVFEKPFEPRVGERKPPAVVGNAADVTGNPFLGDDHAILQVLLPDVPAFDMAMNLFTFQPGTPLPLVESHIMEHGLYLLRGAGVYRLDESWYPMQAGDAIWMGPYCPQWFVAMGRTPATYLYYKDINRDPMAG
jgi:(S)-ureidoglycine aminohydrolase